MPTLVEALELSKGQGRLYLDIEEANQAMAQGIKDALEEAQVDDTEIWIWANEDQLDDLYLPLMPNARLLSRDPPTLMTGQRMDELKTSTRTRCCKWSSTAPTRWRPTSRPR